ncbi:MAG: hypothetical protein C0616_08040 [Desulfuromonas sp.]|nr:MAG: hypothetical protein C0616_08040 [Desulfuromonas sp.]
MNWLFKLCLTVSSIFWFGIYPCQSEPLKTYPGEGPESPLSNYSDLSDLFSLYQPYLANISAYEPIYFLVGADPKESKFQLSMKYRLFNPKGSLNVRHPWLAGIHLAYTQTSFWDLKSDSAPFSDTSYKPEFFFLTSNLNRYLPKFEGLFFQFGLQHESNGRGEQHSRSTNFFYLKPYFIQYNPVTKLGLQLSPRVFLYINNDGESNADLSDYRGYFDLETKLGKADGFVFTSNIRMAKKGISFISDLTYPVSNLTGGNFDLYLQVEYSNVRSESLLNYEERVQAVRIGFAIVR